MIETGDTEFSGVEVQQCHECRGAGSVVRSAVTTASPVECRTCDGRGSRYVYTLDGAEAAKWWGL